MPFIGTHTHTHNSTQTYTHMPTQFIGNGIFERFIYVMIAISSLTIVLGECVCVCVCVFVCVLVYECECVYECEHECV
jgi:hypothetical protein